MSEDPIFPVLAIQDIRPTDLNELTLLNHATDGQNSFAHPHKHDFYLIFLIIKSAGTHDIDFKSHLVKDFQIHFVLPGQVHNWKLAEDTEGYQLMFTNRFLDLSPGLFQFSSLIIFQHPVLQISKGIALSFLNEFQLLEKEFSLEKLDLSILQLRTALILKLVLREFDQQFPETEVLKRHKILLTYESLIHENYKQEKTVAFYADQLNISANYLNILCNRYYQVSANTLIKHRVVLEARRLLQISTLSVKEIAVDLGFNDLSYFSNFFKRYTGQYPSKFKITLL